MYNDYKEIHIINNNNLQKPVLRTPFLKSIKEEEHTEQNKQRNSGPVTSVLTYAARMKQIKESYCTIRLSK